MRKEWVGPAVPIRLCRRRAVVVSPALPWRASVLHPFRVFYEKDGKASRITVFSRTPSLLTSRVHSPSRRDHGIHTTERGLRGRYQENRRQGGTQKGQAHGAQKGRTQSQAHHPARLDEEKSQEDGPRPVETLTSSYQPSALSFQRLVRITRTR